MTESGNELKFTFGLVNSANKYLTAEKFGFGVTANATAMKTKQIWNLEQKEDGRAVFFKSSFGRYLGTDKNGKVSCDSETPGPDHSFQVEATADGRWAIKNESSGYYFGGSGDQLDGFSTCIDNSRLWIVHLAMHPQINLFSVSRSRYAFLSNDELQVTKSTPWGVETLITLVYKQRGYGLMTFDNKYLNYDGKLSGKYDVATTAFTLEFYAGSIAFKSKTGKYLSPQGPHGVLKVWKNKVTRDEKFTMRDSHPQVTLFSVEREKYVSTRQGVQVRCSSAMDKSDVEEQETFQMEIDPEKGRWSFKDSNEKYWTISNGAVMVVSQRNSDSWFDVEWLNGKIRLRCDQGNIGVKPGGNLVIRKDEEPTDFVFSLINRPLVVFRGEYGFVGNRATKLEGNRANYDIYEMKEHENNGTYAFKGSQGKYWKTEDDGTLTMGGETPEYFSIELKKHTLMAIKSLKSGGYVKSDHVGIMTATGKIGEKATLWEY